MEKGIEEEDVETYQRMRTDHARFAGSEHSVSSSVDRVAAVRVFESKFADIAWVWCPRKRPSTYLQSPVCLGRLDMQRGNRPLHIPVVLVQDLSQPHRPQGCTGLAE